MILKVPLIFFLHFPFDSPSPGTGSRDAFDSHSRERAFYWRLQLKGNFMTFLHRHIVKYETYALLIHLFLGGNVFLEIKLCLLFQFIFSARTHNAELQKFMASIIWILRSFFSVPRRLLYFDRFPGGTKP